MSKTFIWGQTAYDWNTIPIPLFSGGKKVFPPETTLSPISISPLVGFSNPAISLNIVVLPQPEGPNKVINSPSLKVSVKGFKTSTLPKDLLNSFIVIVDIFPPKLKTYLL